MPIPHSIPVTLKGCQDYSSACAEWARRGDCEDNTVFMFAFCRWSCKQCAKSTSKHHFKNKSRSLLIARRGGGGREKGVGSEDFDCVTMKFT